VYVCVFVYVFFPRSVCARYALVPQSSGMSAPIPAAAMPEVVVKLLRLMAVCVFLRDGGGGTEILCASLCVCCLCMFVSSGNW
jgi:hypothetical protein